jgi:hypothetical protein
MEVNPEALFVILDALDYTYRIYKWSKTKIQHRIRVILLTKDKKALMFHADDRNEYWIHNKSAYLLEKKCITKAFDVDKNKEIGREIIFYENNPIPLCFDEKLNKTMKRKIENLVKEHKSSKKQSLSPLPKGFAC